MVDNTKHKVAADRQDYQAFEQFVDHLIEKVREQCPFVTEIPFTMDNGTTVVIYPPQDLPPGLAEFFETSLRQVCKQRWQ